MKTIRVLLAASIFALFAGIASANCGTCEKKEHCGKSEACAMKCEEAKSHCEENCDKPCCKKECPEADKAKCETEMSCCEEAAKAGKTCEKCNPPAKE